MSKISKYFFIILFSAFFMFLLTEKPTLAIYQGEKNKATISVNKDEIRIKVTYQRGFSKDGALYKWCKKSAAEETIDPKNCGAANETSLNYVTLGGDSRLNYIAKGDASYVDKNLTTYVFVVPKEKDPILNNLKVGERYVIVIQHAFCALRSETGGEYQQCDYYDTDNLYTTLEVYTTDLIKSHTVNNDIQNKVRYDK